MGEVIPAWNLDGAFDVLKGFNRCHGSSPDSAQHHGDRDQEAQQKDIYKRQVPVDTWYHGVHPRSHQIKTHAPSLEASSDTKVDNPADNNDLQSRHHVGHDLNSKLDRRAVIIDKLEERAREERTVEGKT
ncbi:unnamed protein product [Fusarium graminearum]|nr:unnamed protein product [Fusarium graminearum]CAG1983799.1 unnamed protein product [Fusarium graminearum]